MTQRPDPGGAGSGERGPERELVANPAIVRLLRERAGLSQKKFAERIGLTQRKVSRIELGEVALRGSELQAVARALETPPEIFSWPDRVYGFDSHEVFHRRRQRVAARRLDSVHADMNLKRMQLDRLMQSVEFGEIAFPRFDPDEFNDDIERIAQLVRASWRMPRGPVRSVVAAIEAAGGVVLPFDFGTNLVDAMSQWVPGFVPTFYINTAFPADRTRWSLAHEIGHIVMHASIGPDAESEANRFASEFLMPRDEIVPHLRSLSIARLAELKPLWKVSMAALIKRATDTNAIGELQGRRLWIRMSQLGYRKNEPLPLEPEEPQLYKDFVSVHLEELGYEPEQLRRLLGDPEGYWVPSDNRQLRVVK